MLQNALYWLHGCCMGQWGLCWGGSRSTKPCIFPCKVAAGSDEGQLVYEAVAGTLILACFFCRAVTVASSCFGCVCVCAIFGCFGISGCRSHWNACMIVVILCCHARRYMRACHVHDAAKGIVMAAWMLHGCCFGEEAGARNLVFFRVKWLQAAMKGSCSCVRRLRVRSFKLFFPHLPGEGC